MTIQKRLTAATSVLARHSVVIAGQPDDVYRLGNMEITLYFEVDRDIYKERFMVRNLI